MCQHSCRSQSGMKSQQGSQTGSAVRVPNPQRQGHTNIRKGGQSPNTLQTDENRRSPVYKTKGRKQSFHTSQSVPQMKRFDVVNGNYNMNYSGNRSAGSSPTKQFYSPMADRSNTIVFSQRERTVSRSITPPSKGSFLGENIPSPFGSPVPNLAYAGAKFSDPPSPKVLPKPPVHWFTANQFAIPSPKLDCLEITNALKGMLKVQC